MSTGAVKGVKKICFDFQNGECRRNNCKFSHDNVQPKSNSVESSEEKVKYCFAFEKGECSRGNSCKFSHREKQKASENNKTVEKIVSENKLSESNNIISTDERSSDKQVKNEKEGSGEKCDVVEEEGVKSLDISKSNALDFPVVLPRPQKDIPGFEGLLSCCTDWPQTKKGGPPPAQSAIFNPLLACALGEITGYCSTEQIEYAIMWWSAVFPSFSRWISELRDAGLTSDSQHGRRLMNSAFTKSKKNEPQNSRIGSSNGSSSASSTNNLIFKCSKSIYGEVPHFTGKEQNAALELAPMVAIEVYACVACLYSS